PSAPPPPPPPPPPPSTEPSQAVPSAARSRVEARRRGAKGERSMASLSNATPRPTGSALISTGYGRGVRFTGGGRAPWVMSGPSNRSPAPSIERVEHLVLELLAARGVHPAHVGDQVLDVGVEGRAADAAFLQERHRVAAVVEARAVERLEEA